MKLKVNLIYHIDIDADNWSEWEDVTKSDMMKRIQEDLWDPSCNVHHCTADTLYDCLIEEIIIL